MRAFRLRSQSTGRGIRQFNGTNMRACKICGHPKRKEIEQKLASGVSYSALLAQYGLSKGGISRHRKNHFAVNIGTVNDALYHPAMRTRAKEGSPSIGVQFWGGQSQNSGELILEGLAADIAAMSNDRPQTFGYSAEEARRLIGEKKVVKAKPEKYINTRRLSFEDFNIAECRTNSRRA